MYGRNEELPYRATHDSDSAVFVIAVSEFLSGDFLVGVGCVRVCVCVRLSMYSLLLVVAM